MAAGLEENFNETENHRPDVGGERSGEVARVLSGRPWVADRRYRGPGIRVGAVAFFPLQNGLILALWPKTSITRDAGLSSNPPNPTELTIGHNVGSKEEVDAVMEQAERAGARVVKAAATTFWGGYAGYFQDPDEHLWEIAWNPELVIPE